MESFFEVKLLTTICLLSLTLYAEIDAAMFRGNFPEITVPSTEGKQYKHNYLYPIEQRPFILKTSILIICIMKTCGQSKANQLFGQIIPPSSEHFS